MNKNSIWHLIFITNLSCSWCYVQFVPNIVELLINECKTVQLMTQSPLQNDTRIELNVEFIRIANVTPHNIIVEANSSWRVQVCAKNPGSTVILAKINYFTQIVNNEAVLHVNAGKIGFLRILSITVGWIYFVSWSATAYTRIYDNYVRQSVVGLSFDYCWFNLTGFFFYTFFNIGMFFVASIQEEYLCRHPTGLNPVKFNDIVFSNNILFSSLVAIYQCYTYEKSDQRVSTIARTILLLYCSVVIISAIAAFMNIIHWLDFLYYCSYIKLSGTLIKYIPQALLNYKRKSTVGWCVSNVILDFTGGVFSMAQMLINGYNYDDWGSLFGDPTKFGLGVFSAAFDILFLYQHYILYRVIHKK